MDTEEAIIRFNETEDKREQSKIYEFNIHPAICKLVENVIHKYKFYHYDSTYEDLKHETVIYLYERLNKFTRDKGKAFSYFTVIARNYLIVRSTENYDSVRNRDPLEIVDERRDVPNEVYVEDNKDMLADFVKEWSEWGISNVEKLFEYERDQKIAEAVFDIFKNFENVDNYNKKALYILIREHAKVKTQYITKVINHLKSLFKEMVDEYLTFGVIDWDEYLLQNSVDNEYDWFFYDKFIHDQGRS